MDTLIVTIESIKDRIRSQYPNLTDKEIENVKFSVADGGVLRYVDCGMIDIERRANDEIRVCIYPNY